MMNARKFILAYTLVLFAVVSTGVSTGASEGRPADDAKFVKQSVPKEMVAGKEYEVSIEMKNTGTAPWTGEFRLGSWAKPVTNAGGTNLALGKAATQSSTYGGAVASRAVDGNTNGDSRDGSVTHTDNDVQAWWQVDLGAVSGIGAIQVWNRTDSNGDRLSAFNVLVSDTPFTSTDLATTLRQTGVSSAYVAGPAGSPTTITMNRTGRYVRVQLKETNCLSLAEVQVWSDNVTWGVGRIAFDSKETILPQRKVTFKWKLKAPSEPGTYNFQWRMDHEQVNWFGEETPNVEVRVSAPRRK